VRSISLVVSSPSLVIADWDGLGLSSHFSIRCV
jgi:hypothetical protein